MATSRLETAEDGEMAQEDLALLERWTEARDGEAFGTLVSRYGGLVFGACRRVLGNVSDAEDAAQECFVALAAAGKRPGPYLGAWLHRVATYHALSRVRSEERRKRRETIFAEGAERSAEVEWKDIYAYVDEAINELPERFRAPLVAHFLEGKTQEAVGASLGVSRRVVGYRITQGVERCRAALKRRGVYPLAGGALASLLVAHGVEAAPLPLVARLGKVAVVGPGSSAPMAALAAVQKASAVGAGAAVVNAAAAIFVLLLCGAGYTGWKYQSSPKVSPEPVAAGVAPAGAAASAPAPVQTASAGTLPASKGSVESPSGGARAPAPDATSGLMGPSREALEKGHVVKQATRGDVEKALNTKASLEMKSVHISDIVGFLQSSFGMNMALDDRVVIPAFAGRASVVCKAPTYVTDGAVPSVDLSETTLAEALRAVCEPLNLAYVARGPYVWVSSPALIASDKLAGARVSEDEHAMDAALATRVSLKMQDVHLSDIVGFLHSSFDVNIALDYRALPANSGQMNPPAPDVAVDPKSPFVTDGRLPHIALKDVALRDVLDVVSRQLNLAYRVEDGFVWISTPDRIGRETFQAPDLTHAAPALVEALIRPTTIEIGNSSLGEALASVRQLRPVQFQVDAQAVRTHAGTLSHLKLTDLPLSTVLTALLRDFDLAYTPRDQYIVVTSAARARSGNIPESALVPVESLAGRTPDAGDEERPRPAGVPVTVDVPGFRNLPGKE